MMQTSSSAEFKAEKDQQLFKDISTIECKFEGQPVQEEEDPEIREKHERAKRRDSFARKYYIPIAILAGILFGAQNFLLSIVMDKEEKQTPGFRIAVFLPIFVGYFWTAFIYHAKAALSNKKKYGFLWSIETSPYIICNETRQINEMPKASSGEISQQGENLQSNSASDFSAPQIAKKTHRQVNWFNLVGTVSRALVTLSSYILHAAVLYTSTLAGINFSLILNVYSMSPFLTAITFFFIFKEKIHKMHIVGMILILGCIVCTSLSQTDFSSHPNPHVEP